MLVDDDAAANFLNEIILKRSGITERIEVAESVPQAIQLLTEPVVSQCQCPDVIFLDLNMPGKSGWDFLEEYRPNEVCQQSGERPPVIVVLTSSPNPADRHLAEKNPKVSGYVNKPLSMGVVQDVVNRFFPGQ